MKFPGIELNGRTLSRAVVHDGQHPNHFPGAHTITHEIHRPALIPPGRPSRRSSDPAGFERIDYNDSEQTTLAMIRKARTMGDLILIPLSRAATAPHVFNTKRADFLALLNLIRPACETAY